MNVFNLCMQTIIPLLLAIGYSRAVTYQPNWDSLDKRPIPAWYDNSKFGIFINWGIYSVPSYGNEWFWWNWKGAHNKDIVQYMENNYAPGFTYADFAKDFTAELFNPDQWTDIFVASRAKYIVFDSKHHEGYTLWPSKRSFNWNSMDVGPKRDLVGDLANSIRKKSNIHFGIYHSLFEWFNPIYLEDKKNGFRTQNFVAEKTMPELYELIMQYKPDVIWSDGDWEASSSYWNSTEFLAWLYNSSPVKDSVVVNDRWGSECRCKHGDFFTCEDRYNPGKLQKKKWENAMTIDKASWGFRRNSALADYLDIHALITLLAETVSCGGNLLMNIGPTKDGRITPIYEERLRQMGSWLDVNGEAIFDTKPWKHQNDSVTKNVWYTSKQVMLSNIKTSELDVYAIVLFWPEGPILSLGSVHPTSMTKVTLLGYNTTVDWIKSPSGGIGIIMPHIPVSKMPCLWAWVFRMQGVNPV